VKWSAEALLSVINDILDFSKVEAGKLEFESLAFELRENIEVSLKPLAPRARQKGLDLSWSVDPEIPDRIVGDPGRLRQVLVNLIGNAIKFTERGGIGIRVGAEWQTEDAVFLHFSVHDSGLGIPVAKQQTIFEAFSQADGSTTRRYGGTDLGLTISARLVEIMVGISGWRASLATAVRSTLRPVLGSLRQPRCLGLLRRNSRRVCRPLVYEYY